MDLLLIVQTFQEFLMQCLLADFPEILMVLASRLSRTSFLSLFIFLF